VALSLRSTTDGADLTPGIKALNAPGHTPGHTTYAVESQGDKLIIIGDLIHVSSVQFADPSVTICFDGDPASAAAARSRVLRDASVARQWIAGAHIPFPGIGHVRTTVSGFEFLPANYQSAP
jgi:glyoxylase-like metal-dependent hydrolase (beta-lactamase superfamily II)